GVVGKEVKFTIAVGAEEHRAAEPAWIGVVTPPGRLRDLLHLLVVESKDQDPRGRAASIILPLLGAVGDGRVREELSITGITGFNAIGNRQLRRLAARERHGEELGIPARENMSRRGEENRFAVRREATHGVWSGVR